MANNITGPVWRIDTLPFAYTGPVKVINVNWSEPVTLADEFIMQSTASIPILQAKCNQVNYTQNWGFLGWYPTGLKITKLDSGVVQISVGSGRG